jgi:coenzyme F420-reducing hydrogenase alpha subunit
VKPATLTGKGVGAVEAPRGTLYYQVEIKDSVVGSCNVVIPTQQNSISIERDIKEFVESNMHLGREQLALEMEKIVRAYDPCMSCATHFLKVHWL